MQAKHLLAGQALAPHYWYMTALVISVIGSWLAARHYPHGFDWQYTVASALASQKHNPVGSAWFAGSLSLSMVFLWPYVSALQQCLGSHPGRWSRLAIVSLRVGLVCGMLLGLERLLIHDLSHWFYKSHELIAVLTFFGLFIGVFILLLQVISRLRHRVIGILLFIAPVLAIALSQFWLYLQQRHLGWVDVSWRAKGIPVWFSFAFWQWLAIAILWIGLGLLHVLSRTNKHAQD